MASSCKSRATGAILPAAFAFSALCILSALLLSACGILHPGLVGEDDFEAHAIRMDASGVKGWAFNKKVAYGPFHTGKFDLNRVRTDRKQKPVEGWHWSFSDQEDEIQDVKNAFAFDQFDSAGQVAHVTTRSFRRSSVRHYGESTEMENIDSSRYEINIAQDTTDLTFTFPGEGPVVFLMGRDSVRAERVTRWDKGSKRIFDGVLFSMAGKTVAAVHRDNSGTVWMAKGLPDKLRLTLAAAATAVLLKPRLGPEPD